MEQSGSTGVWSNLVCNSYYTGNPLGNIYRLQCQDRRFNLIFKFFGSLSFLKQIISLPFGVEFFFYLHLQPFCPCYSFIWNLLPPDICVSTCLQLFKQYVKMWLFVRDGQEPEEWEGGAV